jgi:hypothetical protein
MPLFGQREHLRRLQLSGVPGLAEVAVRQGWEPVSGQPLDGLLEADLHEVALAMYASPGGPPGGSPDAETVTFTDVYRGRLDGRAVIIANAWVGIPSAHGLPDTEGLSVCAVELASVVGMLSVRPRAYPSAMTLPETPTGHAAFDARFAVQAAAETPRASLWQRARPAAPDGRLAGQMLTEQVRQLMLGRDDWVFRARRHLLCCAGRGPFPGPAEVGERITEVLAIALAIPAVPGQPAPDPAAWGPPPAEPSANGHSYDGGDDATMILPAPVGQAAAVAPDRSPSELAAALGLLASADEALSLLASLTAGEHETLAGLDTPLAALAGAQTAQEATARYRALDPQRKLQLAARFMSARDARYARDGRARP